MLACLGPYLMLAVGRSLQSHFEYREEKAVFLSAFLLTILSSLIVCNPNTRRYERESQ